VIRNLLANALKFSSNASRIEVLVTKVTREVRVSVSDSGIGIRRDLLPHVFDRFRRGDGAHGCNGLGLGLAIARHLVELHGGSISAHSAGEGKGATLSVVLPLTTAERGEANDSLTTSSPAGRQTPQRNAATSHPLAKSSRSSSVVQNSSVTSMLEPLPDDDGQHK
jgi:hypothetical protein